MEHFHKIFLLLSLSPAFFSLSSAQISGVINQYSEVISIDYANSSVEVANPGFFNVDDRVLLIQMKGAQMVTSNNSFFGDVSNINGAGIYEMATVCDVIGNDVSFQYGIHNTYNPNAVSSPRIQLVKVYSGTNETVSGTVTANAWNGATGGIVAIELTGTLTLNANIDVSEQGFRGASHFPSIFDCDEWINGTNSTYNSLGFAYPYNGGGARGARKGEGITDFLTNLECGKGAQVNGGGGGNDHNTGGGGGGNRSFGGKGGNRDNSFLNCYGLNPGLGGEGLAAFGYSTLNNHVFMGGGGGGGDDNNNESQDGGDGGGLILIMANQIEGNGNAIRANGGDALDSDSDGGAGGGAGGTILLSTNGFGMTNLTIEATGGDGADTHINCEGPGGGGSGGVIWSSTGLSAGVTTDISGGSPGGAQACSGANQGAASGSAGVVQTGYTVPEEVVTLSTSCVLSSPVELFAEEISSGQIQLSWDRNPQVQKMEVEKYLSNEFQTVHFPDNQQILWLDPSPLSGSNRYRLKIYWSDGSTQYSNQLEIFREQTEDFELSVFPNPLRKGNPVSMSCFLEESGVVNIFLLDITGKKLTEYHYLGNEGNNHISLNFDLSAGVYFVKAIHQGKTKISPFVVGD